MNESQIKALANTRRGTGWADWRSRSPKALGDMSGLIVSRIGAANEGPGVQDFDYDTMSKLYVCNDMAWTCIELVSSTTALGKLKVRRKVGKDVEYLPDHPLQKLLDFPNQSMTQFDLIQSYVTHQRLYGTVGMLLLRDKMTEICPICTEDGKTDCIHKFYINTVGPITQIMPMHPSNFTEEVVEVEGKRKKLMCYCPSGDIKYPIHPDNFLSDPFYNTSAGWYGVSPTFLLKRWLDLDATMTHQIKELFDNGSIPSMIINLKPGNNFTYEQEPETLMEAMKSKWMSQFSGNSKGSKSPAFVYGDVTVERLQDKIEDSLAKGLYYEIENRVCATYGVPPTLYEMGLKYGSQRSSAEQAEKDFFNRTISKILVRLEAKINRLIVPSYGDADLEVVWDLSSMGIASFLIEEKKAAVRKDWEIGLISRDDARSRLDYDPVGGELGDDFYRLTVMSDGSNASQAEGMDNRLVPKTAEGSATSGTSGK